MNRFEHQKLVQIEASLENALYFWDDPIAKPQVEKAVRVCREMLSGQGKFEGCRKATEDKK